MKLIDNIMTINAEELLNNPNATIIDTNKQNSTKNDNYKCYKGLNFKEGRF